MFLYYFAVGIYVFICLLLLIVVLLQQGRGGDIAAAFGGASSQTAFGARSGATVLTRTTWVLFVLFVVGALALGALTKTGGTSSVISGKDAPPPATTPAPPPLPTTPPLVPPAQTNPPPGTGKTPDAGKTPAPDAKTPDTKPATPPATPPTKPGRGGGQ